MKTLSDNIIEEDIHRILCNSIMDYKKEFFKTPNRIKINASTLNKLRMAFDKLCMLEEDSNVMQILGMEVEIDHSLTENFVIIYSDENIYTRIYLAGDKLI